MSGISPFMWMLLVWGAVTTVFVILMIYRSLFSLREDDQLFLNTTESLLEAEQTEIRKRISRVTPYAIGFGFASAGLGVLILCFWSYQGLTQFYSRSVAHGAPDSPAGQQGGPVIAHRVVILLLLAGPVPAQSLRVLSEFQRADPFGKVVPVDRTEHPREIISPGV